MTDAEVKKLCERLLTDFQHADRQEAITPVHCDVHALCTWALARLAERSSPRMEREGLIRVIAIAWAEKSSLRPTLEQTLEYQAIQAKRFIASGEAAGIADAILRAFTAPPSDTARTEGENSER